RDAALQTGHGEGRVTFSSPIAPKVGPMRFLVALALALLLLMPSHAQDAIDDGSSAPKPDSSMTVQIDSAACRYATKHVASADYTPGVDVNGNAVAPADLPGSRALPPVTHIDIPVTYGLAQKLNLPPEFGRKAYVGVITLDNGQLSFNGQ